MTATYQTYTVTLTFRYPAWDERDGLLYTVTAMNKREAIKRARRQADNDGQLCARAITDYSFRAVAVEA